jgi:uncharacterized damage-inducible protein DinB
MTEAWLMGPVAGIDPLHMPAAHAFVQVQREVPALIDGLTVDQLWRKPGTSASIGYHVIHLAGATERLLTYARGETLSEAQLGEARLEPKLSDLDSATLSARVDAAMTSALDQLRGTPDTTLLARRDVGRQKLPSNVLGLIFHAAEHATRHAGQVATLRRVLAIP